MKSTNDLFELVHSLNKGEKRQFKLYASLYTGRDKLYVQLFDMLEKQNVFNEPQLAKKLKSNYFPVIKNRLYEMLLKNASMYNDVDGSFLKRIQQVQFLMDKNLVQQAKRKIKRLKTELTEYEKYDELLVLLNLEREIVLKHLSSASELEVKKIFSEIKRILIRINNVTIYSAIYNVGFVYAKQNLKELKRMFESEFIRQKSKALCYTSRKLRNNFLFTYYDKMGMSGEREKMLAESTALYEEFPSAKIFDERGYIFSFYSRAFTWMQAEKYKDAYEEISRLKNISVRNKRLIAKKFSLVYMILLPVMCRIFPQGTRKTEIEEFQQEYTKVKSALTSFDDTLICFYAGLYFFSLENYKQANSWNNRVTEFREAEEVGRIMFEAKILQMMMAIEKSQFDFFESLSRSFKRKLGSSSGQLTNLYKTVVVVLEEVAGMTLSKTVETSEKYSELVTRLVAAKAPISMSIDLASWLKAKEIGKPYWRVLQERNTTGKNDKFIF